MFHSVRKSSHETYARGFAKFQSLLVSNNVKSISLCTVFNFLNSLLESKLAISTINVYKSALSALLFYGFGINLDCREVSQFMKGVSVLGFKPDKPVNWNATSGGLYPQLPR